MVIRTNYEKEDDNNYKNIAVNRYTFKHNFEHRVLHLNLESKHDHKTVTIDMTSATKKASLHHRKEYIWTYK